MLPGVCPGVERMQRDSPRGFKTSPSFHSHIGFFEMQRADPNKVDAFSLGFSRRSLSFFHESRFLLHETIPGIQEDNKYGQNIAYVKIIYFIVSFCSRAYQIRKAEQYDCRRQPRPPLSNPGPIEDM